jgi:RNA polymerase sigma factor (sigma-70 family)
MDAAMAGEKQNIVQAVKHYGRHLFAFIRSRVNTEEDAEDILQDVWYQLSSQTKSEDIISLSGWLYRVARNRITDSYRKKKDDRLDSLMTEDEEGIWQLPALLAADDDDPETRQWQKMFREALAEALEELPEKQRQVFVWNELEDMTLKEIADQENENIKTIISRKRYAVQHLRKRLEFLNQDFFDQ